MNVTLKEFFYFGVASLALIALASPFPEFATFLVVILIVGVVLTHVGTFTPLLKEPKS